MPILRSLLVMSMLVSLLHAHVIPTAMLQKANARLEQNPDDIEALMLRSHDNFNKGMYADAAKDFERILGISEKSGRPQGPGFYLGLANLYFRSKDFAKALPIYEKILTIDFCKQSPSQTEVHQCLWDRAIIYFDKQEYQLSWQDAQAAVSYFPQNLTVLVESAKIADKAGARTDAIRLYSKSLLQFPTAACEATLTRLLTLFIEDKKVAEAQQLLTKLTEALPQDPLLYFYRGLLHKHYLHDTESFEKDMEKALTQAQRIINVDENIVEGSFWECRIFLAKGQLQSALLAATRAIDLEPNHPVLYELRATIYEALQEYPKKLADSETRQKVAQSVSDDWLQCFSIPLPDSSNALIEKRK